MSANTVYNCCLLYTSDAADELDGVDLGGRRIIKKKFFQAEDGIRDRSPSRGLGDVYKRQGVKKPYPIGQSPAAQLRQISEQAHFLCQKQYNCLRHSLLPMLRKQDILLVHFNELDAKQKKQIARYFEHTIFPVLTPLAVDQSRPFPLLANRSLNLAVRLKKGKETHFAVVQVPSILPRFIAVPNEKKQSFILLELSLIHI